VAFEVVRHDGTKLRVCSRCTLSRDLLSTCLLDGTESSALYIEHDPLIVFADIPKPTEH
jgi:hypothetical protein